MAVRKAIKAGKISSSIDMTDPRRPKIDPVAAAKEWGKNYDPSYVRTDKVTEKISISAPSAEPPDSSQEASIQPPQSGRSLAEIKRQTAEVKLRLSALELKEKQGQLVDKERVYRALFAAGQEIRTAFQSIPDRFIDDILAAKTRNEAHGVLFNAIADTLEMLHEINTRNF